MGMHVLGARAPGDDFSFNLVTELIKKYAPESSWAAYLWAGGLWNHGNKLINALSDTLDQVPSENIVLIIRDHFNYTGEFNFTAQTITDLSSDIKTLVARHTEKNFVICVALEQLDRELADIPNLQIVYLGGDITNHAEQYKKLLPVTNKESNSDTHFISLNRGARSHRLCLASMLYALGLDRFGKITFLDKKTFRFDNFLDHVNWQFSEAHAAPRQMFIDGYPKLKATHVTAESDDFLIYKPTAPNDNVANFNRSLRKYYTKSFVEIVSETTVTEPAFLLTEKTLNNIYGCNFPIYVAGRGAVKLLRHMGMDVFDDIIDHSYDDIEDPVLRIYHAVVDNLEILENSDIAKSKWAECKSRFAKNVEFARSSMYTFYINRATLAFEKLNWR